MKRNAWKRFFSIRPGLAILGGILFSLSFPKAGIAGFAWVAPALVLFSALGTQGKHALGLGFLGGAVFFLTTLGFLLYIPFPAGAIAGWLALGFYCALFVAVWVWLSCRWFPFSENGPRFSEALEDLRSAGWARRQAWALKVSILFTALEFLRSHLLTGFPFCLLGATQVKMLPLIQISSITGVYGVSFVVAYFSISLIPALSSIAHRQASPWSWGKELFPAIAILTVTLWSGFSHLSPSGPEAGPRNVRIALIQPDIPQELVWEPDPAVQRERFETVMRLSREALMNGPDLLIFPESGLPPLSREMFQEVRNLVVENQVPLVFGLDHSEEDPDDPTRDRHYNASFLMGPDGGIDGIYRKQRLVIFGEYVPLADTLPFLKFLTPIGNGFSAGEEAAQFTLDDLGVTTSVLICFEDAFARSVRHHVRPDTDFLINLTNDGWFGESSAQWQHAENAAFRAVENGVPLVRATNNGITCWIDLHGRIHDARYPDGRSEYEAGFKIIEVPVRADRRQTFFNKYGNWFGWTCVVLAALQTLASFCFRGKRKVRLDNFS